MRRLISPTERGYAYSMGIGYGIETRKVPRDYHWDGMQRGKSAQHYIVCQYTLHGWGEYADESQVYRVEPGKAFFAVIPGKHTYYLPEASARQEGWTFFWMIVRHTYLVERMMDRQRSAGPVWTIDPESALVHRWLAIVEGLSTDAFRDGFALEQGFFDFLVEFERFGHALVHPQNQRHEVLEDVRRRVEQTLSGRLDVEDLAAARGMSRSHFTHWFTALTNTSPAAFIRTVRLEVVKRQLMETRDTLYAIARRTGFADANHLCKVFKRDLGMTPGDFRRRMR